MDEQESDSTAPEGGIGGQSILDPRTPRKDIRLLLRAINGRWPVEDGTKKLVVDELSKVVECNEDARNKIAAARVLVAADSVNAKREIEAIKAETEQVPATQINVQVNNKTVIIDPAAFAAFARDLIEAGGPDLSEDSDEQPVDSEATSVERSASKTATIPFARKHP